MLKKAQEELKTKTAEEITELKKETDRLVIEKDQLVSSREQVEGAITDSFQYIHENLTDLDAVAKAKRLGEVIAKILLDNNLLNAMVYPDTPPKKVPE